MVLIKKKKHKTAEEIELEQKQKDLRKVGIQDEFQARGFELVSWMQEHRNWVMGAIVVILLSGVGVSGWFLWNSGVNEKASIEYQAAVKLLDEQTPVLKEDRAKMQEAKKAFEDISKKHQGSDVGRLATLYVGHLALKLAEPEQAVVAYQSFLDSARRTDKLRGVALTGLAYAYEANSNPQKSLETFEKMVELKLNIDADNVLWEIARLAKATGSIEKARQNAQALLEQFPDSPLLGNAEMLLASLPK